MYANFANDSVKHGYNNNKTKPNYFYPFIIILFLLLLQ